MKRKRRLVNIKCAVEELEGILLIQFPEFGEIGNRFFADLYYLMRLAKKAK